MPYKDKEKERKCKNAWYSRWVKENPEKAKAKQKEWNSRPHSKLLRRKNALKRLGWTLETYDKAFCKQRGKCVICKRPAGEKGLRPDHNHTTGKARQLLCYCCNTALGLLNEDIVRFEAAICYLKRHTER